jgi:hypothetical protein
MTTCATQEKVSENVCVGNLFLPVPDKDFRDFPDEVLELGRFAPDIVEAIEKDLDGVAREKKRLRLADKRFLESQTDALPTMDIRERNILAAELSLAVGRPRLPGEVVYVFLMMRGFYSEAYRFLKISSGIILTPYSRLFYVFVNCFTR